MIHFMVASATVACGGRRELPKLIVPRRCSSCRCYGVAGDGEEELGCWLTREELLHRQGERVAPSESCTVGERESCKRRERKELLCVVVVGEEEDEGPLRVCVFLVFLTYYLISSFSPLLILFFLPFFPLSFYVKPLCYVKFLLLVLFVFLCQKLCKFSRISRFSPFPPPSCSVHGCYL